MGFLLPRKFAGKKQTPTVKVGFWVTQTRCGVPLPSLRGVKDLRKMKTDKWKLSSGPFLFSVLQFICEQFLLVTL